MDYCPLAPGSTSKMRKKTYKKLMKLMIPGPADAIIAQK